MTTLHPVVDLGLALPGSLSLVARTPSEVDSNLTPLLLDVCAEGISLFGDAYFHPLLIHASAFSLADPPHSARPPGSAIRSQAGRPKCG